MAIVIDFLANVRNVLRGTSDVEQAFGDVADSLDDVARDGQRVGDRLGDDIRDGARDAERSVERLERSFQDLSDVSRRETRRASDDLAENTQRGTSRASEDLQELGNEARANAAETFSSFDGSAQSFADGIQGTLGGIVSSLGPMGAVAGAAGALGIGLIMSAIDQAGVMSEEFKAKVADLGADLIETGEDGAISLGKLVDVLRENAQLTEDQADSLARLDKHADGGATSFAQLAQAVGLTTDGVDELIAAEEKAIRNNQAYVDLYIAGSEKTTHAGEAAASKQIENAEKNIDYLRQQKEAVRQAAEQERLFTEAGGRNLEQRAESMEAYASGVESALTDAGAAWEDYTHDGIVSLDEYNAAIEAQAAAITAYQGNVVTATQTLSQEALNYIMSLGPEAAPLLQAYIDAPLEQKERTAANWATLGAAASTNYTEQLKAGIPGEIPGPVVRPRVDLDQAYRDMEIFQQQNYNVGVGVLLRNGGTND